MKIVSGLLALAILGVLAFVVFDPSYRAQRETAAWTDAQRQRAAVAAEATQTAINLRQQETVAPVVTGAQVTFYAALGITGALGVVLGAFFLFLFLARRLLLVRPTATGVLPTPLVGFGNLAHDARASLAAYHATEYQRAGIAPVPHTFSPSYSYTHNPHHERRSAEFPADAPDLMIEDPGSTPGVPTFQQLVNQGTIGSGQGVIFGYDADGQPVSGTLKNLYSCGIGGGQGSGKTSVALYLAAQTALHGGELVVIDPHGDAPSGLGQRIAPLAPAMRDPVAVQPRDVVDRLTYVWNVFKDREIRGVEDEHPVLLIIDEWTALLRRDLATKLPKFLADLAIDGRKFAVYFVLCAHRWSVEATGGADVRNMLSSHFVARNRSEEVRMQTGFKVSTLPVDPLLLEPGKIIFIPNAGAPTALSIPFITDDDMLRVGATLAAHPHAHTPAPASAGEHEQAGTGVPVRAGARSQPHTAEHNAGAGAGTGHHDAVLGVPAGVPAPAPAPTGTPALAPDEIRALRETGWSKTKIAQRLHGTKAKRLAMAEKILEGLEVDDGDDGE